MNLLGCAIGKRSHLAGTLPPTICLPSSLSHKLTETLSLAQHCASSDRTIQVMQNGMGRQADSAMMKGEHNGKWKFFAAFLLICNQNPTRKITTLPPYRPEGLAPDK